MRRASELGATESEDKHRRAPEGARADPQANMMIEQRHAAPGAKQEQQLQLGAQLAAQLAAAQQRQQAAGLFAEQPAGAGQLAHRLALAGARSPEEQHALAAFESQHLDQQQLAQRLAAQSQLQHSQSIENYLLRQRQQHILANHLERLRTISSCSNESNSTSASHSGRHSALGDHCFLEPQLDHLMDCATSASSLGHRSVSPSSASCSLFGRLTRQLRLLESPSDSGVESGKENGCGSGCQSALGFRSVTPNGAGAGSLGGSACMSPINGLPTHHQLAAAADALYHYAGHRAPSLSLSSGTASHIRSLALNGRLAAEPAPGAHNNHQALSYAGPRGHHQRPASAMSQRQAISRNHDHHSNHLHHHRHAAGASSASGGSIEDMPMLKRALQAPPLINANMLMDEAYRHHKKFRAARGGREPGSDQQAVCSTSGSSSVASHNGRRSAESAGSSARASPAPSPSPSMAAAGGAAGDKERAASRSSLADMHSTLLKKLNQPANQMSEKQLKCNDLISEIILNDKSDDDDDDDAELDRGASLRNRSHSTGAELEGRPRPDERPLGPLRQQAEQLASPVPSGAVAPASSPVSTSSGRSADSPRQAAPADGDNRLSNLHSILISGPQKQRQAAGLLGGLNHFLMDEDYIARRLKASGALKRQQQAQPQGKAAASPAPAAGERAQPAPADQPQAEHQHHRKGHAHNHHRPSSSCASSASPSPTSSLSTLSPSPSSSSMSPDLGMISQSQLGAASLNRREQPSSATPSGQHGLSAFSSPCSSASSSPIPGANAARSTFTSPSCQQLSQISKLSLNCSSSQSAAFVRQHQLLGRAGGASGAAPAAAALADQCGNFGLLADVAIAAAEEQSRMDSMRLQQQVAAAAAAVAAQPIDLSKK